RRMAGVAESACESPEQQNTVCLYSICPAQIFCKQLPFIPLFARLLPACPSAGMHFLPVSRAVLQFVGNRPGLEPRLPTMPLISHSTGDCLMKRLALLAICL